MRKREEKRAPIQVMAVFTVVVLAIGTVPLAAGDDDTTRLEAKIFEDDGAGSGQAKFEVQDSRVRVSIQIEDVMLPCESFAATIGGMAVAGDFADYDGVCDLNLDTRDGDSVPAAAAGDEVIVTGDGITLYGILHFK